MILTVTKIMVTSVQTHCISFSRAVFFSPRERQESLTTLVSLCELGVNPEVCLFVDDVIDVRMVKVRLVLGFFTPWKTNMSPENQWLVQMYF